MSADLNAPEPPPAPGDGPPIWDLVVADMCARDKLGRRRYGTALRAHNGRDALVDAYQEALDLVVYLRQAIEERKAIAAAVAAEREACAKAVEVAALDAEERAGGWVARGFERMGAIKENEGRCLRSIAAAIRARGTP